MNVDSSGAVNADITVNSRFSSLQRQDVKFLWLGIAFSFAFTLLIWITGETILLRPNFLPDIGPEWYYWKLPPDQVTFLSRASAWLLYAGHQLFSWGVIVYAKKQKARGVLKYSTGLHRVNYIALGGTAFFIVLHYLQSLLFYDGLAQDVSVFSSQGSVILMLVFILIMENPRRGMFFGKKAPGLKPSISRFVRKYHGYYFAWALVYTFWFHPMESTPGHLLGFLYMFLLMLQGTLAFTRIHINKYWMIVQEVVVLIHGTIVAIFQGSNIWPLFFFGFGGMFIISQMWGLDLPKWANWSILAGYVVLVIAVYGGFIDPTIGLSKTWQLVAIPMIDYVLVFVFALVIGVGLKLSSYYKTKEVPS